MKPFKFVLVMIQATILLAAFVLVEVTSPTDQDSGSHWTRLRYGLLMSTSVLAVLLWADRLLQEKPVLGFQLRSSALVLTLLLMICIFFVLKFMPVGDQNKRGMAYKTRYHRMWTLLYILLIAIISILLATPMQQLMAILESADIMLVKGWLWATIIGSAIFWYVYNISIRPASIEFMSGATTKPLMSLPVPAKLQRESVEADSVDRFDARDRWSGAITPVRDQGQCMSSVYFACTSCLADRWAIAKSVPFLLLSPQFVINSFVTCTKSNTGISKLLKGNSVHDPSVIMHYLLTENNCEGGTCIEKCCPYVNGGSVFNYDDTETISKGRIAFLIAIMVSALSIILKIIFDDYPDAARFFLIMGLAAGVLQTISMILMIAAPLASLFLVTSVVDTLIPSQKFCFDVVYVVTDKTLTQSQQIYEIQKEIANRGPVVATLTIYKDFCNNPRAYDSDMKGRLGAMGVTIIGWKADYWLVRTSLGPGFGMTTDAGCYFHKMATCGIEDNVVAGHVPALDATKHLQQVTKVLDTKRQMT